MDPIILAALIGAGGVLCGAAMTLVGIIIAHFLTLRADKIKRERDSEEEAHKRLREDLSGQKYVELTSKAIQDMAAMNRFLVCDEFYHGPERYFATDLTDAEIQARVDEGLEAVALKVHPDEFMQAWFLLDGLKKFKIQLEESRQDESSD